MKYNRSYHLPWSPGGTSDDKRLQTISSPIREEIVVTEKMDGGNGCFTRSGVWARSHASHPKEWWWDACKSIHASVKYDIDPNLSIFGENVWPIHSIVYPGSLPGPFMVFNIRNDVEHQWLSWDDVELIAELLDLPTVPVLFRGTVNSVEELINLTEKLGKEPSLYGPDREGVVVRVTRSFSVEDFPKCLGKWVRKDHVQSNEHWTKKVVAQPCFR